MTPAQRRRTRPRARLRVHNVSGKRRAKRRLRLRGAESKASSFSAV
jgi:hypothetical protein